jgi:hypothetical protein
LYYLGLAFFYRHKSKRNFIRDYGTYLNQIAPHPLVDESQKFFTRIVSKFQSWYLKESEQLKVDVSTTRLWNFTQDLARDLGIDAKSGSGAFSNESIPEQQWNAAEEETD